jgi:hypothetical protein
VTGCDIVQGYQDAGDTLFPEQSTHLAAPGVQLVSGNYRNLGLVAGSEIYLLARPADDETGTLVSMRYLKPEPCELSGVTRFTATQEPSRAAPLLSYFNEDVRRGTLRFADAACRTYSLTFEDARLPIAETPTSLVVWAGSDLLLATPEDGSSERLAEGVDQVVRNVFGKRFAVRSSGHLALFDADWKLEGSFGDEVGTILRVGESVLFEDATGVHRLSQSPSDASLVDTLLVRDACSLGTQDGVWIGLRSPCVGGDVVLIHAPRQATYTLPFDAEPTQLLLTPALGSPGLDPLSDPFWFFYLRSGEDVGSEDSLFVRTPAGDEHVLGAHASLRHLRLVESESETHGYALVEIEGEAGRYVWWNAAGETKTLSESLLWQPERLIVDYDGVAGSVAIASGDRLEVLATGVPWQAFEYQDSSKQWTVLFHDMHEGIGKLSLLPSGIDQLEAAPYDAPLVMPQLTELAPNAVVFGTSALNELLSGVLYLSGYDLTTRTGRLDYRNLELRFTASVSDGVSDYFALDDQVLYAVPYGEAAGIWLVQGK